MDFFAVLCGLAFVLGLITVVGHGIWVAIALVWRAMSGDANRDYGKPCRNCGTGYSVKQGRCVVCGAVPQVVAGTTLREELKATARQLRRMLDRQAITQEQYDSLASVIQQDLAALSAHIPLAGTKPGPGPFATAPAVAQGVEILEAEIVPEPSSAFVGQASSLPAVSADAVGQASRLPTMNVALQAQAKLPPDAVPASISRGPADMLQAFMEESNIRWGEIIAASLIVACSVGLVISLRATLQAVPYFPAALFGLFTVAFHGAGLYTLRRWKLQAVSRVVLIISLLLVPLAISGAIVMSGSGEAERSLTDPLFLAAVAIGAAVFGWVTWSASSELVGEGRTRLTIGILGCSLSQILIHRLPLANLDFWRITSIAAIPLGCFLIAAVGQLVRARRWPRLSERRVTQMLLVLGTAAFALLAPLVLILVHAKPTWQALANLSPSLSLAAAAVLAAGLLIHRRTRARSLTAWQTAGTALLIFAGLLLLLLVGFAWPDPKLLVAIGVLNCVILVALGALAELPLLYVPATACAALASVIGWHLARGRFVDPEGRSLQIVQAALMSQSGLVLTALAAMVAGLAWWLQQKRRSADALMLWTSIAGLAALSIGIGLISGFAPIADWPHALALSDSDLSAVLLMLYAGALLVAAPRLPWPAVAGVGSLLFWTALVQVLWLNDTCRDGLASLGWLPDRPILVATLAHGVLTAFGSAAVVAVGFRSLPSPLAGEGPGVSGAAESTSPLSLWERAGVNAPRHARSTNNQLALPLAIGAAASLLAILPAIVWVWNDRYAWHAVFALFAAAGWSALAWSQRWKWSISGLQAMTFLAAALAVASLWHDRISADDWPVARGHLLWQLIVLGFGCIVWSGLRRMTSSLVGLRDLLHAPWPAVDQVLLGTAAVTLPVLAMIWAAPLAGWELGLASAGAGPASSAPVGPPSSAIWQSWIALAVVLVALLAALWERINISALAGLGIATYAAVWLAAEPLQTQIAVASAVRWSAAVYAVAWGAMFILREPIAAVARRWQLLRWLEEGPSLTLRATEEAESLSLALRNGASQAPHDLAIDSKLWFSAQPLLFGGLTILLLTIAAVVQSAAGITLRGPAAESVFARMGMTASYAGPLLALVGVLLAYAVREKQPAFALGGSALFQLAVNLAFLLHLTHSAAQPPEVRWAEWLQWNTLGLAGYSLAWLGLSRWMTRPVVASENRWSTALIDLQIALAAAGVLLIAATAAWRIVAAPALAPADLVQLGGLASYLALALALAAVAWRCLQSLAWKQPGSADLAICLLAALMAIIAATANQFDPGGRWLAYHTLTAGWLTVAALAAGAAAWRGRNMEGRWTYLAPHHFTAAAIAGLVVALAIRGNQSDPQQPWWSLGATGGAMAIATALGTARRSQLYAHASVLLAGLAVLLFWMTPATAPWISAAFGRFPAMLEILLLALAAAAGYWQGLEIRYQQRRDESFSPRFLGPRIHAAAILALLPLALLWRLVYAAIVARGMDYSLPAPFAAYATVATTALLALGALIVTALWDRRGLFAIPASYSWCIAAWLLAIGLVEHRFRDISFVPVAIFSALALHVALSGQVWSYGAILAAWGARAGISDPVGGLTRTARWLPPVSLALALAIGIVDLAFVLTIESHPLRVVAAFGPAVAGWGLLCLAQEKRRDAFQLTALLMAGLAAVYLGWAQFQPIHTPAAWLDRVFRLLMVLGALTFAYGLVLPRWLLTTGSWNATTRRAGYLAGVASIATFIAILALEVVLFQPGTNMAAIDNLQVGAIAAVLVLLIAGLVSLALLPGRDPLLLSETNRQAYVYAAQAIAALLFAHLYICRPLWFDGVLRPYWPFIVMGLAFLGVGCAELFHRWRLTVLAQPLERTGALLPILPVLGIWVVGRTDDALILLVVGLLYLALSYTRKSWAAMAAAAVAGNGALWALLADYQGFGFAAHPQFWLIPPALSVLAAAQLNRHRLQPQMLAALRYGATIVIYVSSTSEIYLRGIGESVWPPIILLSLAVAGAMLGMLLRVRSFLFLGTAFTLVGLVAMVWHANRAIDHTWPAWAFGITLGIAILALFGLFEKKRPEMLALISRLKQWEL